MAKTLPRKKRGFSLLLFLISCFAIVVFAKDAFVSLLADLAFGRLYPKKEGCAHGYMKAKWEGKTLCVFGVEITMPSEDLLIEKVELVLGIKPHLYVIRPQWLKKTDEEPKEQRSFLPLLSSKFLRLDVVEGRYLLYDKTQVLFSLESFDSDKPTSRMSFFTNSEAIDAPFLEALFSSQEEGARIEADSKSAASKDLLAIADAFFASKMTSLEGVAGNWTGNFSLELDRNWEVMSANGSLSGQEFTFSSPFMGWKAEGSELDLRFTLHPSKESASFLQRLEADAAVSQGSLDLKCDDKEYRMQQIAGHLSWNREADPKFYLEGALDLDGKVEKAVLEGMGRFEDVASFHLTTQFLFGDKAIPVAAGQISIRTEDVTRLHMDIDLERIELPLLKCFLPNLSFGSGSVKLKSHFLYEKNRLCGVNLLSSHIETSHFETPGGIKMENLSISVEGRWEKTLGEGWIAKRVKSFVECKEVQPISSRSLGLEGLSGEFLIEEGQIEQSSLKATLSNIPLEIVASGNWSRPTFKVFAAGPLELFANAFADLKIQTQSLALKEPIEISCECAPFKAGYTIVSEVLLGADAKIDAQFFCDKEGIHEGSLSATHLPLTPIAGFGDFNAAFDLSDGRLELVLQGAKFVHEKWELKVAEAKIAYESKEGLLTIAPFLSQLRCNGAEPMSLETKGIQLRYVKPHLEGTIEAVLSAKGKTLGKTTGALKLSVARQEVEFLSEQSELFNLPIDKIHVQLSKEGLRLEELKWQDCKLSADIAPNGSVLSIHYDLCAPTVRSTGAIDVDWSKNEALATPTLAFSWANQTILLKPQNPVKCRWDTAYGVKFEEGRWEEQTSRSKLKFSKMDWNYLENKVSSDGAEFTIAPALMKTLYPSIALPMEGLEGTFKVFKNGTKLEITGTLNDGEYGVEGASKELKALQWRFANGNLLFGAKAKLGALEAVATFQFEHPSKLGLLKVQEAGDDSSLNALLRFDEKGEPHVQKITGEAFGLKVDLKSSGKRKLAGRIDVDFSEFALALPAAQKTQVKKFKLGKGFSFEGEISYASLKEFSCNGVFKGRDCSMLGASLKNLEAQVALTQSSVAVKNLLISDKAVTGNLPRLNIEKTLAGAWTFACPLLQIKDLVPCKLFGEKENPFAIRNLSLVDVEGTVGSLSETRGKCILHFTNAWKKETTILDLPRNFLKDLGLEPSLFVPVQGEFLGHFERGRLLLTELKGAFSEDRRTRFALSSTGEGSYVDFEGNLHIDLIMRQSVLLKVAETMMLGIRGRLEKPRYVLVP